MHPVNESAPTNTTAQVPSVPPPSAIPGAVAGAVAGGSNTPSPNPNNPSEYCSTIPPHQQGNPSAPPPTVMVPIGVLRKDGNNKQITYILK